MSTQGKRSGAAEKPTCLKQHVRTSIGNSVNTAPKNKHKKLSWKKYRGQGKK